MLREILLIIQTFFCAQKMELERLRNSITALGQELADQQQRLDKGEFGQIELV